MRQRRGIRDVHLIEALKLKHWVVQHQLQIGESGVAANNLTGQSIDGTLESVMDCPQQDADTVKCAMMVCFIMRQHVHMVEIDNTMDSLNHAMYRAAMVKTFLNDPKRGLRARPM